MYVFTIDRNLAEIGNRGKQLNIVTWNHGAARLDLRSWRTDDDGQLHPNKGITLTDDEARELLDALRAYFK